MVTVTGVRWAESPRRRANHGLIDFQTKPKGTRKKADQIGAEYVQNKYGSVLLMDDNDPSRRLVEQCFRTRKTLFNPIIDWTDEDVWGFIRQQNLSYCSLYDEGFKRLGCIGCPLSGRKNMERDFERWPRYKELYIRAFQKMIENHPGEIRVLKLAEEEKHKVPCENGGGGTVKCPVYTETRDPQEMADLIMEYALWTLGQTTRLPPALLFSSRHNERRTWQDDIRRAETRYGIKIRMNV